MDSRTPLKYRCNHQGGLHRNVVKAGTRALSMAPVASKYGVAARIKRRSLPYKLLKNCVGVQVGAPHDTLSAGRSRAAHIGNEGYQAEMSELGYSLMGHEDRGATFQLRSRR